MAVTTLTFDNSNYVKVTISNPIWQHSSNDAMLKILTPRKYETRYATLKMDEYELYMQYCVKGTNKIYAEYLSNPEIVVKGNDAEYLEYLFNCDAKFTDVAGDIEITFVYYIPQVDGAGSDRSVIRKTSTTTIKVLPVSTWSEVVSNENLTAFDKKLGEVSAKIEYLNSLTSETAKTFPVDLEVLEGNLHLTNISGEKVGDGVPILSNDDDDSDGNIDGVINLDSIVEGDTNGS